MSALPTAARASLERAARTRVAAVARRHALTIGLVGVVLAGGWLRLDGADWDDGGHLHPDERYLSIVADNLAWPGSVSGYFDVEQSPLSPYNTEQGRSYVYGTLPLFATMSAASAVGQDEYGELNILGRRLSALVDTATIVFVFLTALLLLDGLGRTRARAGALLAASLYAFTVTAIQHAHFFTTDTWLAALGLLTFYLAARGVRSGMEGSTRFAPIFFLVGACLGLTVACKASGALIAIPVVLALLGRAALGLPGLGAREALLRLGTAGLAVLVSAYVAFRAVSPYTFAHSSWLDLSLNPDFRAALESQRQATAGAFLYPPSYQWLLSPRLWGPLENLVVWQLGVALGLAALGGVGLLVARIGGALVRLVRRRAALADAASLTLPAMLASFVLVVFFYMASRFGHSGRYLVPIVPFLCVAAAYGLAGLTRARRRLLAASSLVVVAATAFYAVAFHRIYTEPNTRMAASDWIAANVPAGSTIANEHWDDPLPVGGRAQVYTGAQLPVFDADDGDKLRKLYDGLAAADYYFLSSPRAWRTIGRLPDRFPLMARFYEQLFAGRLGFAPVASFSSEPELFGLRFHDVGAEEAFWVYDHPPVTLLRRTRPLVWEDFRRALCPARLPPACA